LAGDGSQKKKKPLPKRLQQKIKTTLKTKEIYLSIEEIDHEVYNIITELSKPAIKTREWDAALNLSVLIVTDIQNYFLSPESHAFIPSAPAIIPNIKKLISIFREYNRPVIFTKHTNNKDNAGSMDYWWNDLVDDEGPFSELYGSLHLPEEIIIIKHQYDAFHATNLDHLLNKMGVRYPVICGVMTNLCCETTVRSAFVKGYHPVLPIDATAAYNRQFHLATFRNLSFGFSPLMTTEEVINKLKL
jgi:nicotinamidase-related amidase